MHLCLQIRFLNEFRRFSVCLLCGGYVLQIKIDQIDNRSFKLSQNDISTQTTKGATRQIETRNSLRYTYIVKNL